MATFVYYNPSTNKIEKVKPYNQGQQTRMLNLTPITTSQPVMKVYDFQQTKQQIRSDPNRKMDEAEKNSPIYKTASNKRLVQTFDTQTERSEKDLNEKSDPLASLQKDAAISDGLGETVTISHAALFHVEDLHEEEFPELKHRVQRERGNTIRATKAQPQDKGPSIYSESKAEDLDEESLKNRVYDRLLEGKAINEAKKKKRLAHLNAIANEIQRIEEQTKILDQEIQKDVKNTEAVERKANILEQEMRRRMFERETDEITKRIDGALKIRTDEKEEEDQQRLHDFKKENRELYQQIHRALSSHGESLDQSYEDKKSTSRGKVWPRQAPSKAASKTKPKFNNNAKTRNPQKTEHLIRQANKIIKDSLR